MLNELLSIIVPVYNAECYLNRCVDSILASTYEEIEVLLIDDGSTDNSLDICRLYEENDKRVRVLHKENGGMCSARNFGMEHMHGRYLAFVDNDDYIDATMYEKLISLLRNEDVLAAECSWIEFDTNGNEKPGYLKRFGKISLSKVRGRLFEDSRSVGAGYIWNSVFDYQKLCELSGEFARFNNKLLYYEDINFQLRIYAKSKGSIYVTNEALYHYFIRSDSFSHSNKTVSDDLKVIEDTLENVKLLKEYTSWFSYKRALGNYYNTKVNTIYRHRKDRNSDRWQLWHPRCAFLEGFNMWVLSWRFPAYYYKYFLILIWWVNYQIKGKKKSRSDTVLKDKNSLH